LVIPERLAMVFIIIDNPRRYTTTHMFLCAVVLSAPYSRVIEFILRALTCFFAVGCWLPSSILCKQHSTPLESGPVVKHTIQRQIYKIQKKRRHHRYLKSWKNSSFLWCCQEGTIKLLQI
jgi:hypothetical protein